MQYLILVLNLGVPIIAAYMLYAKTKQDNKLEKLAMDIARIDGIEREIKQLAELDKEITNVSRLRMEGQGIMDQRLSAFELEVSKTYATKESARMLFNESQQLTREAEVRLMGNITETKTAIRDNNLKIDNVNNKIDTMTNTILTALHARPTS